MQLNYYLIFFGFFTDTNKNTYFFLIYDIQNPFYLYFKVVLVTKKKSTYLNLYNYLYFQL